LCWRKVSIREWGGGDVGWAIRAYLGNDKRRTHGIKQRVDEVRI
jgi:hypothetical protein